ncbi:hypothetical protein [Leadbetterella sp. DM7]|uniref:hypothetical protein n=1 Tax=Leadbetterella sp. DM7 TaxID=3235085 RepID=UPI00349EAFEA
MKKYLSIAVLILSSNTYWGSSIIRVLTADSPETYLYFNSTGKFNRAFNQRLVTVGFQYDNGAELARQEFRSYLAENPGDDRQLYRNFRIYPFKFWRWREYLTCDCYRLPYQARIPDGYFEEITKNPDKFR